MNSQTTHIGIIGAGIQGVCCGLYLIKKGTNLKKISKFPSITNSFLKSKLIQDLHFTSSPPSTRAEIPNFSEFGIEVADVE